MMFTTAGLTCSNTSANEPVVTLGGLGAECAAGVKSTETIVSASAAPAAMPASHPVRTRVFGICIVIATLLWTLLIVISMRGNYAVHPYAWLTGSLRFCNPSQAC